MSVQIKNVFVVTPDELKLLIEAGTESPRLDYKESTPCDAEGLAKDVLAMSNIQDGGRIVIGVKEKDDGSFEPTGVEDVHLESYKSDELKDKIGAFADPYVDFSVHASELDGKKYVILVVREFSELPVICKKDGPVKNGTRELQSGRIYTRTRRGRPSSEQVSTHAELRSILKMAIDKGMSDLHRRGYVFEPASRTVENRLNEQVADLM